MTFISHAQNREDVLLWRALKHVKKGFYVDVGANHPSHDSVTKAFYDRGWSGINIEPLQEHFEELQRVRLRDINLQLAAGNAEGELDLYDSDVRGLATASLEVAEARRAAGGVVRACRVPVRRLDAILTTHAPEHIHFLKVDVEGFETAVLQGMDFTRWRPWVVVIEATKPNSRELELGWEPLLTSANYQFVWFDGLNRYYLAAEHMALSEHFQVPPNVFDEFVPAEQERLRLAFARSENERKVAEDQLHAHQAVQLHLDSVLHSRSWQLTRPLRVMIKALKALKKKVTEVTPGQPSQASVTAASSGTSGMHLNEVPQSAPFTYWHELSYPREAQAPTLLPSASTLANFWWRLTGHLEGHYSLAEVNRSLALELDQLSQGQLQFVPWHGQPYMPQPDARTQQSRALTRMAQQVVPKGARVISLVHHYPPMQDAEAADLRLTLFFWEESFVPNDIVALLNSSLDGVLVASQFVRRALRFSGCDRPIFVVPMGVQVPTFDRPTTQEISNSKAFRYLHVSSAFERKGVDVLLEAYGRTFSGDDAVELYIKTFANPHHDMARQVSTWRALHQNPPTVIVDISELDESQMDALYQTADVMVLPSRGEGFGLPAARALAMGTPLITTAGSGQADFASLGFAYLVPYHCAPSRSHVNQGEAYWLEPDVQSLMHKMASVRHLVLSGDLGHRERQNKAAQWVGAHYNWRQSALSVESVAHQLLNASPVLASRRKKVAVISPWRTTCGIAEYAHDLLKDWDTLFDLRVYCDARTTPDPAQDIYVPKWKIGQQESLLDLLQTLLEQAKAGDLDLLFIQHQQSLFLLTDDVCMALSRIHAMGVQVMLELHSTLPMVREGRLGRRAVHALRELDLILVHKVDDVNCMLGLGLSHNVMYLPLSVPTFNGPISANARQDLGLAQDDWVLGCFGILWPHKGVDLVIKSMPLIAQASGKRVKLLAVTAVIDEASRQMLQTCQDMADALGVSADIVWITDFLPIQEAMRTLAVADVQLFVYGPTRESASGAVTIGLATHKPVLVSPQHIFSDLSSCTYALNGMAPADVAQGVLAQISAVHHESPRYAAQQAWLQSRSWARTSERLQAIIRGFDADRQYPQRFDIANEQGTRQLLVDVTQIASHDTGTGIQRVVRNIVRNWLSSPPDGYVVSLVRFDESQACYCYERTYMANLAQDHQVSRLADQVQVGMGDIFVGLDLTAHLFPQAESLLAQWRLSGVRVCYVVYDIIPLLHPNWAYPGTPQAFDGWARSLRRQSDRVICISRAVADELRLWWCAHTEEGTLPEISHFHLGADLGTHALPSGEPAQDVAQLTDVTNAVLMVGTVEPRKGHALALDAFDQLWAQGNNTSLVIVGKRGWNLEPLFERITSHPRLGRNLFWLEAIDDASLQHLYINCKGLLMASEAEGFGLPLIEAAQHGLPILARDIPVFRELADSFASYFSGHDAQDMAGQLHAWLQDIDFHVAPASRGMKRLNWQASAQQLLEEILCV